MSGRFLASLTTMLLAVTACTAMSSPASADFFSFSYGGGGGHHHRHHHHHHGPSIGIGWYAPPPPRYVYVEPPIYRERVYVQPPVIQERVIVQQAAPAVTYSAPPAAASTLPPPPNRDTVDTPVVIRNNSNRGVPVAFVVDQKDEELNDGQTRTFSGSGSRVIEFDRGGNRGAARYEVTGGLYSFVVTANGWDLVKDTGPTQTANRPTTLRKNELPGEVKMR